MRWSRHLAGKTFKLGPVVVIGLSTVVYNKCRHCSIQFDKWNKQYIQSLELGNKYTLLHAHHGLVSRSDNYFRRQRLPKLVNTNSSQSALQAPHKTTAARHILLIRHGQYIDNAIVERKRRLTSLGRIQSELTGQKLREMNFPYTRIISSPMKRAIETAEVIQTFLPGVNHVTDDNLEEVLVHPEIPLGSWRPEHERYIQDRARVERAFRNYFKQASPGQTEDSYEIMVCHTNVISFFINKVLQHQNEVTGRSTLANCSITHIVILPSGLFTISTSGDHRHLPRNRISYG